MTTEFVDVDVRPILRAGGEPFSAIMQAVEGLEPGQGVRLFATFKPIPLFGMEMPAVTYLNFLNLHSSHHRGQLSAYLRPMGAKVPAIYGGSADEPMQH